MADRDGLPIVECCVWCGGAHDSKACPVDGGSTAAGGVPLAQVVDTVRLSREERATVYGAVAKAMRLGCRVEGAKGYTLIPLHKRALLFGVPPDVLERACDPGPGGGVDAKTAARIRQAIGNLGLRRP